MCCQDPPPPPDLGPMSEASLEIAQMNQQTSQEQLAWAREQDTMNRETLNRVLDIQLPAMEDQAAWAKEDRQRWEDQFRPLEDAFVKEAQEYDSPERRQREMAGAIADTATQFDAQRRNALQRLESYGVDPSQTRNAALDIGVRTQQAMAQVGASNQARDRVENVGRALRSDAINMGRGALSNASAYYGQAVNAGTQAVGGANQTTATGAGAAQSAMGWSGQALQGYGQGANIATQGYGNQMQQWGAGQQQTAGMWQGIGGLVGMGMADGGDVDPTDGMIATGMGDGSGIDDNVPIMASDGEYVIPADVVSVKGTEFFDRLVEKYHTPAKDQRRAIQ